ncbi:hypothetical protein [Saccharopolyspora shandongensis]|uniref:hypothetical protein n=1 Tax=Saccharopolyspora shandongensis TaxID=418495 RepID=UPI0033FA90C5
MRNTVYHWIEVEAGSPEAARGVMSREKREDERRHRANPKYWPLQEYKIQRRPVTTGWEDIQ